MAKLSGLFFDTLLSRLNASEIEAVLAHELGHFKHRHVIKRIVFSFVMSLAFLWGLGYLMQQPWFYEGLGVSVSSVPSTALALLLFFLVMPIFTFYFIRYRVSIRVNMNLKQMLMPRKIHRLKI